MSFYVFLSSADSADRFPANTYDNFIVELDKEVRLEEHAGLGFSQRWTVALTDLTLQATSSELLILPEGVIVGCDLIDPSYINGTEYSLLRTLPASDEICVSLHLPYYIGVNKLNFRRIRIELKDSQLGRLSAAKGWAEKAIVKCTLHFQRI